MQDVTSTCFNVSLYIGRLRRPCQGFPRGLNQLCGFEMTTERHNVKYKAYAVIAGCAWLDFKTLTTCTMRLSQGSPRATHENPDFHAAVQSVCSTDFLQRASSHQNMRRLLSLTVSSSQGPLCWTAYTVHLNEDTNYNSSPGSRQHGCNSKLLARQPALTTAKCHVYEQGPRERAY